MKRQSRLLVTCLTLGLATPGWAAAQSRFSGVVVFGTSLSDSGNAFRSLIGATAGVVFHERLVVHSRLATRPVDILPLLICFR